MSNSSHQQKSNCLVPLSLLSALALAAPNVFAAAAPQVPNFNSSDAVKGAVTPDPTKQAPNADAPPAPVILQEKEEPMQLAEGQKIAIRDFRVEGADFLDPKAVSALLEPYRNQELTMSQIREAANRVTVYCRDQGYMVARAYVPKQDAQDGVLLIKVIAGKYGAFQMKNHSLVRDSVLQSVFERAKQNSGVVTRDSLERAMLLVSDMPGALMPQVAIAPGTEAGTSDFTIDTPASKRVKGYALADNYGSRFTGKARVSAGLDINSPLGFGDKLSLSGTTSKAAGLQNGRGAYSFPLASNGLRAEIAASRTTYKLGDQYADLDATGHANIVEATISYPIKRTRLDNLYISLNVANKSLQDDIAVAGTTVGKHTNVATLGLLKETYGTLFGFNTYVNVSGGLSFGRLDFDDATQAAENRAGADTTGDYSKANLSFIGNLAFNPKWSVNTFLQVQQALGRNLDGIEQISISGPGTIKSYADGVTGDNGYVMGAELKYALPSFAGVDQSVGTFVNYGAVRAKHGGYTTIGTVAVSDVGLSYYVSNKTLFGQVQLSRTIGIQGDSIYNGELKLLAQAGLRF